MEHRKIIIALAILLVAGLGTTVLLLAHNGQFIPFSKSEAAAANPSIDNDTKILSSIASYYAITASDGTTLIDFQKAWNAALLAVDTNRDCQISGSEATAMMNKLGISLTGQLLAKTFAGLLLPGSTIYAQELNHL